VTKDGVDACGTDEVEAVFVKPDDSDQLVLNMHPATSWNALVQQSSRFSAAVDARPAKTGKLRVRRR
jgi:hypothetical protein